MGGVRRAVIVWVQDDDGELCCGWVVVEIMLWMENTDIAGWVGSGGQYGVSA